MTLRVCCALDMDRSARDKAAYGVKEGEGGGWGSTLHSAGQVLEPRPSSAAPGRGAEPRTAGGDRPGSAGGGELPAYRQPRCPFPATQTAQRSQERHTDSGGDSRSACRPRRGYVLLVPASLGRPRPAAVGEAFSGPTCPSFLLSPFRALSPRRTRLLGTLPASAPGLPGYPALPSLLPSLLTPQARLKRNSRPSFRPTRASPER